ncbi:MAG: NUDIX hydrolase [Acidimicrobiia bacterium]|nr:NUDIX hydrolase [Acidimicrobiaceae bacterium]MXW68970.1 NUDIX hydrolase [Acidimicrobiia bacterium]MXW60178.1 NUDIX hydrolase [Acidimicrobiaceae bacterium]MYC43499.1 NUDIX hydrolase [Acidimicrobiaceae bacterium]MYD06227.1 NUDIX hydrolase [Acidimicrobiaceae bacterium]
MVDPRVEQWITAADERLQFSARLGDVWETIAPLDSPEIRDTRDSMRALLDERPQPLDRRERPGHFTASALVVNDALDQILLLHHTKLKIWVQPGGHVDGNANLMAVALREATEETGIGGLRIWPQAIDLDIHRVNPPSEDAHLHYDVRFLVLAPQSPVLNANHESAAQRWVSPDDLPSMGVDDGLQRLTRTGLALARSLR